MKSFMKLIITILVVAIIGFTVGYLLMNGTKKNNDESGDVISGDNILIQTSGEKYGEMVSTPSGDLGEISKEISGENILPISKEEKIERINEQVQKIGSGENEVKTSRENLSLDLVNDSAKDFMKYFKVNELPTTVNVKPGFVEIIPDQDFIENMVYYFDENGELILYESVSTTVGGSCKYYFDKGTIVSVVVAYEEDIEAKEEYIGDILNRAQLIHDKYAIK